MSAWLLCGPSAVISHASAAVHHRLYRIGAPTRPHVTVPHGRRHVPAAVKVHSTRELDKADVLTVGGVDYTTLARTVCDLADGQDPWETLALVDDAVARGAKQRWLHQRSSALANGRTGVVLVRAATAPHAAPEFRSWLERTAAHVYRVAGLPDPEWNVAVRDHHGLVGIVDALWPAWRVIAEKEGLRFHTTPEQRRDDAKRFNRLADSQYSVRRFSWEDVVHAPVEVAAAVMRALRAAGADLDPARLPRRIDLPGAVRSQTLS